MRTQDGGSHELEGSADQRFWLDVRRRGLGWEFVVGATHAAERHGWRPTKRAAKRAGKRLIHRLDRPH